MAKRLMKKAADIIELGLMAGLAVLLLFYVGMSWMFPDPDDREWYYST